MHYEALQEILQQVFRPILPLLPAQIGRIAGLCQALLLAGRVELTFLARCVPICAQQDSRVKWIRRLLSARFMTYDVVYRPLIRQILSELELPNWHLIIDRTALIKQQTDLVTISLYYRKRALPLIWEEVPYGGACAQVYANLIRQCAPLLPDQAQIIFHGDTEFGSAHLIRTLRQLRWQFIVGLQANVKFRSAADGPMQALRTLPVTPSRSCQLERVDLFEGDPLSSINIYAFYQPHYDKAGKRKREVCYLATSLPLTRPIRSLGRRRWGIEPFHKDYKSSGWNITASKINPTQRRGFLIIAAICYLLCVCLGRWLCKTGKRRQIDSHPKRRLSLFRIGWDFIVHCVHIHQTIPFRLRVYL